MSRADIGLRAAPDVLSRDDPSLATADRQDLGVPGSCRSRGRLARVLKRAVVGAVVFVALAAGCGGTRTVVETTTVVRAPSPIVTGNQWLHGQVKSIERDGNHYLLRFDPSSFLSGVTANVAQAEDQGKTCKATACPPVANDNYVVDESHRLYTYLLPLDVRGTVLRNSSDRQTITATQLAQLVHHTGSVRPFEPLESGMWLLVHIDTIRTFAQQYVP